MFRFHRLMRWPGCAKALFLFSLLFPPIPAYALDSSEVGRVVVLIEALQAELGPFAYSEGIADEWFEEDSQSGGQIIAAGFSRETWRRALDATIRGFFAALPDEKIEQLFSEIKERLSASTHLNLEQREAAEDLIEEQFDVIRTMRVEGQPYAKTVRPHAPRLLEILEIDE